MLYFVLADLAGVDIMYQFSLSWFQGMFINCIDMSNERPSSANSSQPVGRIRPSSAKSSPRPGADRPQKSGADGLQTDDPGLTSHMGKMIDRLTNNIYRVVSVALFAHHQQTFSFMLCSGIMRANAKYSGNDGDSVEGKIEDLEWTVFLQGNVMATMMDEALLEQHDGM